jgi:hypothetical protein
VVVSFSADNEAKVRELCATSDVPFAVIGETGGDRLRIDDVINVEVARLTASHHAALTTIVGHD